MKKLALALLAVLSFSSLPIAHAAEPDRVVFEAVDSVWNDGVNFFVEGLVLGESQPRTVHEFVNSEYEPEMDRCLRAAQLAQAKPGAYLFSLIVDNDWQSAPQCKLTRR